jgi:hypothetical protein
MMRKSIIGLALFFTLRLAFAQDFQKTYTLTEGGQIRINNFIGNVKVTGYSGSTIDIKAFKKGADRDLIQILDMSFGNKVELMARYSQFYTGTSTADFEVRVPNSAKYNFDWIASIGGSVSVSDVQGYLQARSEKGNVEIKDVRGLVSASSNSGNVTVAISRVQGPGKMRFGSTSGNVEVSAPANLDAFIDMSSTSGTLRTDFPIDVQERRYGPGRWAGGKLGSGLQSLRIRTVSGQISLIRR